MADGKVNAIRLAAAALVFASGAAQAGMIPTDIELRAGYCLRTKQVQLQRFDASEDLVKSFPALRAKTVDRVQRLQSYVLPRLKYLDADSMLATAARADGDWKQWDRLSAECDSECRGKGPECFMRCLDGDIQRRRAVCDELDWLPF